MNFNWKRLTNDDYDLIDTWKSEDITKFVTIDDTFNITDFFTMFGFSDNRTSYKAVDEDGKIIGVILFDDIDYIGSKNAEFNIQLLVVNPEITNMGYGTKMLADIIEQFKDEVEVFKIESETDNIAFQRICEKNGFTRNKKREYTRGSMRYELNLKKLAKQEIKNKKRK